MSMKTFTFNGVSSDSFEYFINGAGVFNSPEPDLEYVSVPGRNGDLIYDNKRFNNIEVSYSPVFTLQNFRATSKAFQAWLLSHKGYFRLEDDYQPLYYRMASIKDAIPVTDIAWTNDAGAMEVIFNCKPQLYLVSGDDAVEFTADGTITNPTKFAAKPLIRVYGTGSLTVGDVTMTIGASSYAYIDIDCELMDCYYGSYNANQYVTIGDYFPTLAPGSNNIVLTDNTITKAEVTPRWWTI